MDAKWEIQLLGGLQARAGEQTIARFRTRKTAGLFAFLAYHGSQFQSREALIDRFWPDADGPTGRNSLRVALNSLRHQLEPPGIPAGAVLQADRIQARLTPAGASTDVFEFEAALRSAHASDGPNRQACLEQAVALYRSELLPGYYEEWIEPERTRLAEAFQSALHQLVSLLAAAQEWERALDYARRAVSADALSEEARCGLMRVYAGQGRTADALFQYHELKRLLHEELDSTPSRETRRLAEELFGGAKVKGPGRPRLLSPQRTRRRKESPAAMPIASSPHSVPPPSGSLPLQFTRFFGRDAEMARLQELLCAEATRLVTLTGPGGTGKTRLAVETASRLRGEFGGAVWFVPLADLAGPELIAGAVRDTLRLPRSVSDDALEQIVAALSASPSLLALDNFEQLAAGGAPLVLTLLKRIPTLKCLVTSRRRLGLPGERVVPLPPLPAPDELEPLERLAVNAAVQLFVDRSQAVRPDFQLTERNASAVTQVCRRLEGLPLAIELVAARASALTPAQMRDRLAQRFELVQSRRTGRHGSLWTAIAWSHDLLPPNLQRFYARLSVFRGGWDLEAAEAVCEEADALELLSQLQAHSFVLAEDGAPALRFRLLETLREFGQAQMPPEEQEEAAQRHVRFFLELAEQAEPHLQGAEHGAWLDRLEAEHDNFRAALDRRRSHASSAESHVRLAGALWRFWWTRGFLSEGRQRLADALDQAQAPPAAQVKVLNGAGALANHQGDHAAAKDFLERSLVLVQGENDRPGIATTLGHLGNAAYFLGEYAAARDFHAQSLVVWRELENPQGIARALIGLGNVAEASGNYAQARDLYEQSLVMARAANNQQRIALILDNLGSVVSRQESYAAAQPFFEESAALCRQLGDKQGLAVAVGNLGYAAHAQGRQAEAQALYRESLTLMSELGDKNNIAYLLDGFANVASALGDAARAAYLWGAAEALRQAIHAPLSPNQQADYGKIVAAARPAASPADWETAWQAGRAATWEQAVQYALDEAEPKSAH